jgi:triacylglycerol lipase
MKKRMIYHYLKLSSYAYGSDHAPFYDLGAVAVHFFNASEAGRADVQFYTLEYENELVFAIRGSQSLSDFMDDAYCWMTDFQDVDINGVRVHAGFLRQYISMRSNMISSVFRMMWKKQNKKIVFTGHSLGGALATLCGAAVKNEIPDVHVSVYTFGSPRVGNKLFAKVFDKVDISVRCVNGSDIVPTIPYAFPFLSDYTHVKGELCVGLKSISNTRDHQLSSYDKCVKEFSSHSESEHE